MRLSTSSLCPQYITVKIIFGEIMFRVRYHFWHMNIVQAQCSHCHMNLSNNIAFSETIAVGVSVSDPVGFSVTDSVRFSVTDPL